MPVIIEAQVPSSYAPVWLDGCALKHDEPGIGNGELTDMHRMPIACRPLIRRILAHGGDDNAVLQNLGSQLEWRE